MNKAGIIKDKIFEHWNPYAEITGEKVVEKLIDNQLKGYPVNESLKDVEDSGTPFDLEMALKIIATAATVVKTILDVLKYVKEQNLSKAKVLEEVHQKLAKEIAPENLVETLNGKSVEALTNEIQMRIQ